MSLPSSTPVLLSFQQAAPSMLVPLALELLSTCAPSHLVPHLGLLPHELCQVLDSAVVFPSSRPPHPAMSVASLVTPRLLGQRTVWPYHSPVPSDLSTRGSQQRLPVLRALGPQSHKDTMLCRPGRFWEQFPSHALTHHTAVFILCVALVNESFSGSSVHKRT